MAVPISRYLPDDSELTTQEVTVTYPHLHAAAFHIGKECEFQNNEYMLCKVESRYDPRKCLKEGKEVTACTLKFFQRLKQHCAAEFKQYVKCLEWSSKEMEFKHCRKTQAVYDKCVLEHLKIERPPFGYFCEARVHDTTRPKPVPRERKPYPDPSYKYQPRWFDDPKPAASPSTTF